MLMIFSRTVIPDVKDKNKATVSVKITGSFDGVHADCGTLKFPSKQAWTKFWGAVQAGALKIPDLECKMENVMPAVVASPQQQPPQQQAGGNK